MAKCSSYNCNREITNEERLITNSDKCIFHCEKNDWYSINRHGLKNWEDSAYKVEYFWNEVRQYMNFIDDPSNFKYSSPSISAKKLKRYSFKNFIFPHFTDNAFFEHMDALQLLDKKYVFSKDVFIENCTFLDEVDFSEVLFKGVLYINNTNVKNVINFSQSEFEDIVNIYNLTFEQKMTSLHFFNAKFHEKLFILLNDCYIENINFEHVLTDRYTEISINRVGSFNFQNSQFFDDCLFSNMSITKDFDLHSTIFNKNTLFSDLIINQKSSFFNTKFLGKVTFYNCFFNTLDLERTIVLGNINFVHINRNVQNRETARIIKDSYEKQNNIIEANKFYELEMIEREKELEKNKEIGNDFFEWMLFKIHGLASNYSQNWLLVLFWIFSFTFSFVIQHHFNNNFLTNTLEYILVDIFIFLAFLYGSYLIIEYEKINKFWYVGAFYFIYGFFTNDWMLGVFSNQLNPFSIMTGKEHLTFGGLIYKVIIAYLIYQLIISIRQNTRRK